MKLTTARLKKLIKEELQTTLREMGGEEYTPDFYYNKLLTLLAFPDEVPLAEMTYLSMKDQFTPEQQAFLDSCINALEIARKAIQAYDNRHKTGHAGNVEYNRMFQEALREIFNNAPQKDDLHKKAFRGVHSAAVDIAGGIFGMNDL